MLICWQLQRSDGSLISMDSVETLAHKLVSIDSQSHVSNATLADFVYTYLEPFADHIEKIEYVDPDGCRKTSIVVRVGAGSGGLALSAHMDTVPGLGWDRDPFEAWVEKGRMYGLGTVDMKGALAATLVAAKTSASLALNKPLTLIYTTDEETNTQGARRIVDESEVLRSVGPRYCIIAEPTNLQVVNAHKAAITFRATARGRAAHSSSGKGVNANIAMIPFINEMGKLYEELVEDEAYWDPDFEPPFPDWNITIDNHGTAANVTVPLSTCRVNFRYTRTLDPSPVIERVRESSEQTGVELESWSSGPPLYISADSELVQLALEVTGEQAPVSVPYRTDGCILAEAVPCIVIGPGDFRQAHTVNEWVSIEQLHRSVDLYLKFIQAVCR